MAGLGEEDIGSSEILSHTSGQRTRVGWCPEVGASNNKVGALENRVGALEDRIPQETRSVLEADIGLESLRLVPQN